MFLKAWALLLLHDDLQQIPFQQGALDQGEAADGGLVLEARLHDGQAAMETWQRLVLDTAADGRDQDLFGGGDFTGDEHLLGVEQVDRDGDGAP